mgnify:CR=1 FL=1
MNVPCEGTHSSQIFSTKQVLEVFKMLTSSKSGYLMYLEVVAHFKDERVAKEMIHRNILHFRDLQPTPQSYVLTASGHPALRAMELLSSNGDGPTEPIAV